MPAAHDDTYPRLVGDIGGTNARFAMVSAPGTPLQAIRSLPCVDFSDPAAAIEHYLAQVTLPRPRWCAIGIANPVDGDAIHMTNRDWAFSISELQGRLQLAHLEVVNDFTALAMALPALPADELLQVGGGAAQTGRAIGLIGPGTGLGVSGLLPCAGDLAPIEGEGGHVTLAARTPQEAAIIAWLSARHPHVSAERVLSGPGLVALHQAHAEFAGRRLEALAPADITRHALAGDDALCSAALASFCGFLGTVAANLALTLGARGGIYIGGGIVPRLGAAFTQSVFRARFEDKGRFGHYLAGIPTFVIRSPQPGLIGAARLLDRRAAASLERLSQR